jgi:hypothetical protein
MKLLYHKLFLIVGCVLCSSLQAKTISIINDTGNELKLELIAVDTSNTARRWKLVKKVPYNDQHKPFVITINDDLDQRAIPYKIRCFRVTASYCPPYEICKNYYSKQLKMVPNTIYRVWISNNECEVRIVPERYLLGLLVSYFDSFNQLLRPTECAAVERDVTTGEL